MVGFQAFHKLLLAISEIAKQFKFFFKVPCVQIQAAILRPSWIKPYFMLFLYNASISLFMRSKISLFILFHYKKSRTIKYDVWCVKNLT